MALPNRALSLKSGTRVLAQGEQTEGLGAQQRVSASLTGLAPLLSLNPARPLHRFRSASSGVSLLLHSGVSLQLHSGQAAGLPCLCV
mmetsp:Transcript_8575/g.25126  ORF Transcript_8575/g.25126 Transcript_8575/m.25126 type:complete len:87 (-) Transcript_8575:48-308(-)